MAGGLQRKSPENRPTFRTVEAGVGQLTFFSEQTGVIRVDAAGSGVAAHNSTPLVRWDVTAGRKTALPPSLFSLTLARRKMRSRTEQTEERGMARKARGFSLIELLIVVAVILIIAAIAIPNFLRSKMRANEASAVSSLRSITTAEVVYSSTYNVGYASTLGALGGTGGTVDQTNAELIDSVLSAGVKSGYSFTYAATSTDASGNVLSYTANADPSLPGTTGDTHFFVDQTSIIRSNQSASAGLNDTPVN